MPSYAITSTENFERPDENGSRLLDYLYSQEWLTPDSGHLLECHRILFEGMHVERGGAGRWRNERIQIQSLKSLRFEEKGEVAAEHLLKIIESVDRRLFSAFERFNVTTPNTNSSLLANNQYVCCCMEAMSILVLGVIFTQPFGDGNKRLAAYLADHLADFVFGRAEIPTKKINSQPVQITRDSGYTTRWGKSMEAAWKSQVNDVESMARNLLIQLSPAYGQAISLRVNQIPSMPASDAFSFLKNR